MYETGKLMCWGNGDKFFDWKPFSGASLEDSGRNPEETVPE
jgi:hypothetical protein